MGQQFGAALLILGSAATFSAVSSVSAQQDGAVAQQVRFEVPVALDTTVNTPVRDAVARFVTGMRDGDAKSVWMFASEEDQDAFATEDAVYSAFAETFPVLTSVNDVAFERIWNEGDTPFASLALQDASANPYRATIGLWQDDAGDWKVISLEINAVSDQIAAL